MRELWRLQTPIFQKNDSKRWGQFFIIDKHIYGTAFGFPETVYPSPNFSNACLTGLSPGNWSKGFITILKGPAMVMELSPS